MRISVEYHFESSTKLKLSICIQNHLGTRQHTVRPFSYTTVSSDIPITVSMYHWSDLPEKGFSVTMLTFHAPLHLVRTDHWPVYFPLDDIPISVGLMPDYCGAVNLFLAFWSLIQVVNRRVCLPIIQWYLQLVLHEVLLNYSFISETVARSIYLTPFVSWFSLLVVSSFKVSQDWVKIKR